MEKNSLYKVNTKIIKGGSYAIVYKKARSYFNQISRQTKRRPYIRSAYFKKEKLSILCHVFPNNKNPRQGEVTPESRNWLLYEDFIHIL